jgi:hypothetical protein
MMPLNMYMKRQSAFARFFLHFESPLVASVFAFLVYLALSTLNDSPFQASGYAYFNYLADGFLHGQLHLRSLPTMWRDLSSFNGHYYLYWPPMPAIVLMPFVAIFGVDFSDVFFNVVVASLNVGIVALLLRAANDEKLIEIDEISRTLLTLFFAFGTVHITLAIFGRVWFTAQQLGFLFVGLAYLSAIRLKGGLAFFVTGLFIACAMVTRNHLLFTGIWPAWHLLRTNWDHRPRLYVHFVFFLLPVFLLGVLFLLYNFARFGSPFELGLQYHLMSGRFIEDYPKYGAFNLYYLPTNFYYQYIHYPFPFTKETLMGGSLFLLSPAFFYIFPGIVHHYRRVDTWVLLVSILATSIPILFLMGTGWKQFGPRYTLDFTVPLLLLTAQGAQFVSKRIFTVLVIISMIHYFRGVLFLVDE